MSLEPLLHVELAWGLSRAGLELGFSVLELFEVKCVNS